MITLDRRRCAGASKPYDAELEYLRGDGTPTITLPLSVAATDFFEVSGKIRIDNATQAASSTIYIISNNTSALSSAQFSIGHGTTSIPKSGVTETWCYRNRVSNGMTFPGGVFSTFALSTEGKTVNGVFTESQQALGAALTSIKIYFRQNVYYASLKIKARNEVLYDLVPVRIGNKGYMYDKVSNTLFDKDGGGSFLLGRDLSVSDNMLYWWESEDGVEYLSGVNYYAWVDRLRGASARAFNYNKVDGLWEIQGFDMSPQRYFQLTNLHSYPNHITLPAAWKMETELILPSGQTSNQPIYLFDNSVTTATHAFGVYVSHTAHKIGVNYKPTSNNDGSSYGFVSGTQLEVATDQLIKIEVGTIYVSSTQVQLYQKYNGVTVMAKAPHDACAYNGNWNVSQGYLGRSYSESYNKGKCYLKSIKFYDNSQA